MTPLRNTQAKQSCVFRTSVEYGELLFQREAKVLLPGAARVDLVLAYLFTLRGRTCHVCVLVGKFGYIMIIKSMFYSYL